MSTTSYSWPVVSSFAFDPLTTTFTPPSACSGIYSSSVNVIDPDLSCLPEGFSSYSTDYFSPGLACPSGYITACNDNAGISSITTVTCCPYRGDITLGCVRPTTLEDVWSTLFCTWIAPDTGTVVQMTASDDGTTSTVATTLVSPAGINAYGIRMVYESSDLTAAATTTTDGHSLTSGETGATATNTGSSGFGSDHDGGRGDRGDVSIGTVVAIAVAIPIVVIGLMGVIFFYIRGHKKAQRLGHRRDPGAKGSFLSVWGDQKSHYAGWGGGGGGGTGSYYDPASPGVAPSEVSGVGVYGVRNQHHEAVELGNREVVELPG